MTIEEIRKDAPDGATHWRDMDSVCSPNEILYYCCPLGVWLVWCVDAKNWIKSIILDGDSDYILEQLKPI